MENANVIWTCCSYFVLGICLLLAYHLMVMNAVRRKIAPSQFKRLAETNSYKIVFYSKSHGKYEYYSSVNGIQIYTKTSKPLTFPDEFEIIPAESTFERMFFGAYKPEE